MYKIDRRGGWDRPQGPILVCDFWTLPPPPPPFNFEHNTKLKGGGGVQKSYIKKLPEIINKHK